MNDVHIYLYVIMHPNYALVASMLPPSEFGKHYTLGSSRFFHGQVMFAEIDINFRNDYFPIERYLDEVHAKPDGSPKRTKFIKCYRVLEHMDLSAFKGLYVSSSLGKVLGLESEPYDREHKKGYIRTFQEICPLSTIVFTYMTPQEFGKYITDPEQPKGAPKVMFCQIDFDVDRYLAEIKQDPYITSPIPNVHSHKLREQILELQANPNKRVKGISLDSALGRLPFLKLRTGFWIAAGNELLYYPIPDRQVLESVHYEWFRSLQQ